MGIVTVNEESLTNIANAIRGKNGKTTTYKPSEMAGAIQEIKGGAPEKGIVVNEWDDKGYATDITIYGLTTIPSCYFYNFNSEVPSVIGGRVKKIEFKSDITIIASRAFEDCTELALTELPDSITLLGESSFQGCENLALTKLPSGITSLENDTFNNCKKLALTELPSGLTSLGNNNTFNGCEELALTELPSGITSIGNNVFCNCKKLALTELPSGVKSIASESFYGCESLKLTSVPYNIGTWSTKAFYGCISLEKMVLPETCNYIPESCFENCTNLQFVEMYSSSATDAIVRRNAFSKCLNFKMFIIRNENRIVSLDNINAFSGTPISSGNGFIYVPDDLVDSYKSATNWSSYADQIVGLTHLNLQSVEITNDVINTYNNNKTINIDVIYNNALPSLYNPEQEGYTLSVSGNATIDGNVLTLTDNAQVGDIITVTVASTYDPNISSTKEIEVVYMEYSVTVDLNDGQWVDSGTVADNGNAIYKSDAGSYKTNNGKSTAIITVKGYNNLKLYIRSFAEGKYDYTEAFAIDTTATRGKGLFTTNGKQSATNYVECVYELDGGTHTIEIMYSKDSSGNSDDDRGYFYIGEVS